MNCSFEPVWATASAEGVATGVEECQNCCPTFKLQLHFVPTAKCDCLCQTLFSEGSPWRHTSKGVTDPTRKKNVLFGFWDINQSFLFSGNIWPMKKELIKVFRDLFLDVSLPYDFMAEWNKQWWFHASSASVNFRQYLSGKLGETIYELYGYGSRGKVMRIYLDIIWHICFFKCIPFVKGQKVHNRKNGNIPQIVNVVFSSFLAEKNMKNMKKWIHTNT